MSQQYTEVTEDSIRALVHLFYQRVRSDAALNAVFEPVIGASDEAWAPHLELMVDFWSSIMLRSGRYHGTPMQKHQALPKFDLSLFDHWLNVFSETARELHTAEIAKIYEEKSSNIARSLRMAMAPDILGGRHAV